LNKPVIVGISGASGVIYGIEMLKQFRNARVKTHLILTEMGAYNLMIETSYTVEDVYALADVVHDISEFSACVASGSFLTAGMVVAPCSIKSLSAVANSFDHNLLIRAADVTLKEKRPLLLMVRETPLHKGHLDLMLKAADLGAVILPPMPAFYHHPETIEDLVTHTAGKALDLLGVEHNIFKRWS
jgi:flavin prenyltransferase